MDQRFIEVRRIKKKKEEIWRKKWESLKKKVLPDFDVFPIKIQMKPEIPIRINKSILFVKSVLYPQ